MAFPDVDIARPIYPPPQILMNVQPSDDNPLVFSSCRAVTTGSRSRFAESPLWPCSSVLLEQPRPINPPSMTAFGPHATEVCNRFKPGRALKHRTDQTSQSIRTPEGQTRPFQFVRPLARPPSPCLTKCGFVGCR